MFLRTCYARVENKFRYSQWTTQRQGSLDVTILTWLSTNNCPLWGWFPTRDFISNGRNVQRNLLTHKNGTNQEAPTLKEVQFMTLKLWQYDSGFPLIFILVPSVIAWRDGSSSHSRYHRFSLMLVERSLFSWKSSLWPAHMTEVRKRYLLLQKVFKVSV